MKSRSGRTCGNLWAGGSSRKRVREGQGTQSPGRSIHIPSSFLLEISRALCQGCGARSWVQLLGSGYSILVANWEKILCNNETAHSCNSHLRTFSKTYCNFPNCNKMIISNSAASRANTGLWPFHHSNSSILWSSGDFPEYLELTIILIYIIITYWQKRPLLYSFMNA